VGFNPRIKPAQEKPLSFLPSETSVAHVNLLHSKDYSHRIGTSVQRCWNEGGALSQGDLKVREHLAISRRLDDVGQRRRAITEDIRYHNHVIGIFVHVRMGMRIGFCERG
jgi:hypothetical protein